MLQATNSLGAGLLTDQGEVDVVVLSGPDDAEYAAAKEILDAVTLDEIAPLMAMAFAELAAIGIADPTARLIAVQAADVATRPAIPDRELGDRPPSAKLPAQRREDYAPNLGR